MTATVWDTGNNGGFTLSGGNLIATKPNTGTNQYQNVYGTKGLSTGKIYWEITISDLTGTVRFALGASNTRTTTGELGFNFSISFGAQASGSSSFLTDGCTNTWITPLGSAFNNGDVCMFALDMSAGVCYIGFNGKWGNSADPGSGVGYVVSGLTGTVYPGISANGLGGSQAGTVNFGATAFAYAPPAGFEGWDDPAIYYTLDAAAGSCVITGVSPLLERSAHLIAATGVYATNGVAVLLKASTHLLTAAGAYVVSGTSPVLAHFRTLKATAGAYAITGISVLLKRSTNLLTVAGAYVVTGFSPLMGRFKPLFAAVGSYAITGFGPLLVHTVMKVVKKRVSSAILYSVRTVKSVLYRTRSTPPTLDD